MNPQNNPSATASDKLSKGGDDKMILDDPHGTHRDHKGGLTDPAKSPTLAPGHSTASEVDKAVERIKTTTTDDPYFGSLEYEQDATTVLTALSDSQRQLREAQIKRKEQDDDCRLLFGATWRDAVAAIQGDKEAGCRQIEKANLTKKWLDAESQLTAAQAERDESRLLAKKLNGERDAAVAEVEGLKKVVVALGKALTGVARLIEKRDSKSSYTHVLLLDQEIRNIKEALAATPASLSGQSLVGTEELKGLREDREPNWIVNDLGELGVEIGGRCYFLYKGESLEYEGLHEDGTPMLFRRVGKREFGETQWPSSWLEAGRREDRYQVDLVYTPGLSFGKPNNPVYQWRPLPIRAEKREGGG